MKEKIQDWVRRTLTVPATFSETDFMHFHVLKSDMKAAGVTARDIVNALRPEFGWAMTAGETRETVNFTLA